MQQEHYRQGDILFVVVDAIEGEAKELPRENGVIVVARGESTGHAHVVTAPDVQWIEGTRSRYLVSDAPFEVQHQEHGAVTLPGGKIVEIVYQYEAPAPGVVRQVRD